MPSATFTARKEGSAAALATAPPKAPPRADQACRLSGSIQSLPSCWHRRRSTVQWRFSLMKRTPPRPPISPRRQKAAISHAIHSFFGLCVDVESAKSVSRFAPLRFRYLSVKLAEKAAMKAKSSDCRLSERTEPSSSAAKSTPPSGAPNAVETPAAAPTHASSCRGIASPNRPVCARPRCSRYAQQTPMWMRGPSLPRERPAPTTSARPSVLMSRHQPEKLWGRSKPETAALTSGMPLPRAAGQYSHTRKVPRPVQTTEETT
mmetsp:Transcript_39374/g.121530  ORF Transcript_39374/g.121530 Transcript_39374/m.121530 type:complete len:262 (+) Transcript_39374:1283-2068(+)